MEYAGVEYDKVYFVNNEKDIIQKLIPIMEGIEKENIINKIFKKQAEKKKEKEKKQWKEITKQEYPFLMSVIDIPLKVDLTILNDLKKIQNKKRKNENMQIDLDKELGRLDTEIAKEKYPKPKFRITDRFDVFKGEK